MAEILSVDKFRNGDPIPHAATNEQWREAGENGTPAWCYYDNDPANGETYGKTHQLVGGDRPKRFSAEWLARTQR